MAKNLKELRDKAATKGPSVAATKEPSVKLKGIIPPKDNTPATQNFIKKHVVAHYEDPAGNGDDVYNASNIKTVNRSPDHGYNPGQDEEVYEGVYKETETNASDARIAGSRRAMKHRNLQNVVGDYGFERDEKPEWDQAKKDLEQMDSNPVNLRKGLKGITAAERARRANTKASLTNSYEPEGNLVVENKRLPPRPPPEDINNYWKNQTTETTSPRVLERARLAAERASTQERAKQPPPPISFAGNFQGLLNYRKSQGVADLTLKTKERREAEREAARKKGFVGTILRTLGLSDETEQVLTNLYNTLNEENRDKMVKLLESEEGFIKLIEFAVEKGID